MIELFVIGTAVVPMPGAGPGGTAEAPKARFIHVVGDSSDESAEASEKGHE
jgi:hypothetical protein